MAESNTPPLPPANFLFLVESILMQAQMQLGLLNFGAVGEDTKPDLAMARHSIDLLGMLQEKTKGNLTLEEERLVNNGLTELRFRFIQVADELKAKGQSGGSEIPEANTSGAAETGDDGPVIITPDGGKGSKTQ
jgi:hypothetical protein